MPDQVPKFYSEINFTDVFSMYEYNPWYISENGIKVENTRIDSITHSILNIKKTGNSDHECRFRNGAAYGFARAFNRDSCFPSIIPKNEYVFALVPSSSKDKPSIGMMTFIKNIYIDFLNTQNVLKRTETVQKATDGGPRDLQKHLDTIEMIDESVVNGKHIILFDDVVTSGVSLDACKNLLERAGAKSVIMIVLGKTVSRMV